MNKKLELDAPVAPTLMMPAFGIWRNSRRLWPQFTFFFFLYSLILNIIDFPRPSCPSSSRGSSKALERTMTLTTCSQPVLPCSKCKKKQSHNKTNLHIIYSPVIFICLLKNYMNFIYLVTWLYKLHHTVQIVFIGQML